MELNKTTMKNILLLTLITFGLTSREKKKITVYDVRGLKKHDKITVTKRDVVSLTIKPGDTVKVNVSNNEIEESLNELRYMYKHADAENLNTPYPLDSAMFYVVQKVYQTDPKTDGFFIPYRANPSEF